MRRPTALILTLPTLVAAEPPVLDEGRLDPAWFGSAAVFQPSSTLGFQWVKPGLDLRHRSFRLKPWEPVAWRPGKHALKDELLVDRMTRVLLPELLKGLRRGSRNALPVSMTEGDVLLVGRIVDAQGEGDDALSFSMASLSFDLKAVDADTGELLGAFHDTLKGQSADVLTLQYARWCEQLGRLFAPLAAPLPDVAATPQPLAKPQAVRTAPAFDLDGALRRIEGLKRDGLLSEEESQVLRKKAEARAKGL